MKTRASRVVRSQVVDFTPHPDDAVAERNQEQSCLIHYLAHLLCNMILHPLALTYKDLVKFLLHAVSPH